MAEYQQANVPVSVDQRISQYVTLLRPSGRLRCLQGINTALVSDRCIVVVRENNSLYILRKESTAAESGDDIIAPLSGFGRWFRNSPGAQVVDANVHITPFIGYSSAIDLDVPVPNALPSDMITCSLIDTGLPTNLVIGNAACHTDGSVRVRLANVSSPGLGATISAGTYSVRFGLQR